MLKCFVVGCGTIGSYICNFIDSGEIQASLVGAWDQDQSSLARLDRQLKKVPKHLPPHEMIDEFDLLIECTTPAVVGGLLKLVLEHGKDILVMSVGGLLDNEESLKKFHGSKSRLYVPSGALASIDGLKSASLGGLESVYLTMRKPPRALVGAPYLIKNNIDIRHLTAEKIIFEGTAREAVKEFPANANISATLSLAGMGPEQTMVKVVADPAISKNIHEVEIIARSGRIITRVENMPSPDNPKTSYLAGLSAVAMLKNICSNIRIG